MSGGSGGRGIEGSKRRAAAAGAALALALVCPLSAQDVGLPLGSVPAGAVVQELNGDTVNLSRHVGTRPAVFEFWATWCPLCEALMPRMLEAHRRYGDRVDFVVVGVGVNQTRRTMSRHLERHPLPFHAYFDATGAAVRAFMAPTTSYVVVLDARGRVVYTGVGEDQDIAGAVGRALGGRQGS